MSEVKDWWQCIEGLHPATGTKFTEIAGNYTVYDLRWPAIAVFPQYVPEKRMGPYCKFHWEKRGK